MRYSRVLLSPARASQCASFLKWPLDPHVSVVQNLREIEAHWEAEVSSAGLSTKEPGVESKYVLAMFPYPSGNLHMGHLRVYCISDSIARYYALNGYRVIHPIGWDAFGLPAENAAIERGVDPETWTYDNIGTMREQLLRTGLKFDWDRELFTCKPDYYRWTQWIFLQLHKHGLVRRAFSEVYWDPVDQTTLAAEQVDAQGRSWRSGAVAERRKLHQWAVETPKYAKLLDGLEVLKPSWRDVADIQANWIGKCDAYRFLLPVKSSSADAGPEETFDLRLLDPQKLVDARFLVIRDGHPLSTGERVEGVEEYGHAVLLDQTAYNFATDRHMPIVRVRDPRDVNGEWLLDARVADPTRNEFDAHLSRIFSFGEQEVTNLSTCAMSQVEICATASAKGYGGYLTSRSLLDWVVSRQRAWGTPIPMVLDEQKRHFEPIGEDDLPVLSDRRGQRVTTNGLPSGHGFVETDTLDTFFDSSWYYLRYLDPHNSKQLVNPEIASRDMPVSVYVGGVEHAVHLFFARFINHFLYGLGSTNVKEPFAELVTQGTVRGKTYLLAESKAYVNPEEVSEREGRLVHSPSGQEVVLCYDKMSKSKFNGVDPLQVIQENGKDFAKLQLLASGGPREYLDWGEGGDSVVKGLRRWIDRMAHIVNIYVAKRQESQASTQSGADPNVENTLRQQRNSYVRDATIALEILRLHNIFLEKLQSLTNSLRRIESGAISQSVEFERCVHSLVIMLQVFAPSIASELWSALSSVPKLQPDQWRGGEPVWNQCWPQVDEDAEIEFTVELFGTTSRTRVNRSEIEQLEDGEILSIARENHHSLLFSLLEDNSICVAKARVEKRPGLHVTISLEFTEEVPSSTAYSILDTIGKEKRRGKRRLGIKC